MTLDESKKDEDNLDEQFGVRMLSDKSIASQIEGAIVDFVDSPDGGGFKIRTAKAGGDSCGSCSGSC